MFSTGNTCLTKSEISLCKAIKIVLSSPIRHSNIDVLYVPMDLKEIRTRI